MCGVWENIQLNISSPQEVPNSVLGVESLKLKTFIEAVVLKSLQKFQGSTREGANILELFTHIMVAGYFFW